MQVVSAGGGRYRIEINQSELLILGNAVNEVVNGIRMDDAQFTTRLGGTRDEVRLLLRALTTR
jgi:hypothetical protein